MITPLPDQNARNRAIEPHHSFIVQAPAGSGKTEILVQRILNLLACNATHPENIIAITFTRKAAQEMKTRIHQALQQASQGKTTTLTQELANKALEQSNIKGWNLLEATQRLNIQTFDALCSTLMQRMPSLTALGSQSNILDDPLPLYQQATEAILQRFCNRSQGASALATLMKHLDLNAQRLTHLLVRMLSNRDQWLPYLMPYHKNNIQPTDFKEVLEKNLAEVSCEAMQALHVLLDHDMASSLMTCMSFAWEHGLPPPKEAPPLPKWDQLPPPTLEFKPYWLALCHVLLTKDGKFRKQLDKRLGFPSPSTAAANEKTLFKVMKTKLQDLIQTLANCDKMTTYWQQLQITPTPHYSDTQWQVLMALMEILPIAVVELHRVFLKTPGIDFIEVSQRAMMALGEEDNPTDLALYLDHKIQHILVDEFQDTSVTQYRLLRQLTTTWLPEDGRTLFLVGDPMQSIYRFRQAEVALFLETQRHGLGYIKPECLYLTANFRSQTPLVEWFNGVFGAIFPKEADSSLGAICYSPATAQHSDKSDAKVQIHPLVEVDEIDMANVVLEQVQHYQSLYPKHSIAVLVRARNHAIPIFNVFAKAKLSYQALDMDSLVQHPVVQDLLTLTRALYHLGDRTAWLALLRASWCGLNLHDLHHLSATTADHCLWECMLKPEYFNQLSNDGQVRVAKLCDVLAETLALKDTLPHRQWIETAWLRLKGPACLQSPHELLIAEAFWDVLETCEPQANEYFITTLIRKLHRAFVPVDPKANANLTIMTIHKAKGLEFDCVILPSLERRPQHDTAPLLHWLERINLQHEPSLLLAPIQAQYAEPDPIFNYLKQCHYLKQQHEYLRLLYVAATRAKHQLHLLMVIEYDDAGKATLPPNHSFAKLLWPVWSLQNTSLLSSQIPTSTEMNLTARSSASSLRGKTMTEATHTLHGLLRLKSCNKTLSSPHIASHTLSQAPVSMGINLTTDSSILHQSSQLVPCYDGTATRLGTVIHYFLEQLSKKSQLTLKLSSIIPTQLIQTHLKQYGTLPHTLEKETDLVQKALTNTLNDSRGRWILQAHSQAASELALTYKQAKNIQQFIIDRTFIADGVRWIIDYKTATPNEESLDAFLETQEKQHQQQFKHYTNVLNAFDPVHPIQCALYFPLIPAWHEIFHLL